MIPPSCNLHDNVFLATALAQRYDRLIGMGA
jgi:hypothetical protein